MAKKPPMQRELFNSLDLLVLDSDVLHLEPLIAAAITEIDSTWKYRALAPTTVFDCVANKSVLTNTDGTTFDISETAATRFNTFSQNNKCISCKRIGNIFFIQKSTADVSYHLDFYCLDSDGLMMMTVDHILLDSLGGKAGNINYQTMCSACNTKKGATMSLADISLVRANPSVYAKSWINLSFLSIMLDLQELMHTSTGATRRRFKQLYDKHRTRIKYNTPSTQVSMQCVELQTEFNYIVHNKQKNEPTEWQLVSKLKHYIGILAITVATRLVAIHKWSTSSPSI